MRAISNRQLQTQSAHRANAFQRAQRTALLILQGELVLKLAELFKFRNYR